jgi:ABC-type sulfate/molybdate transport systems ATPase subunit
MIRIKARKALRDYILDIDIEAGDGETVVLTGSNGSGKSTILNMAAGLLRPDEGVISVNGRTFFDSGRKVEEPPEQRNIGYVFQNYALFPHMTVYDNVAFGLQMKRQPKDEIETRVRAELEPLGMWELRNARAAKLSGGQKQKVALARGLAIKPSLLLLDEPLSALDAHTYGAVRNSLRERIKRDRIPCIVVLHNPLDATALGDKAYKLDLGQVILSGKPDIILRAGQEPREIKTTDERGVDGL